MILTLFLIFLKIGFLGFGGGYAMLSLIFDEASNFGMTISEFADLNALDFMIPGPIAINSATYIGQVYGGITGSIAATIAVCCPSFVFVPIFMYYEKKIKNNHYLNSVLRSVKAASAGLIIAVAASIMLENTFNISSISELSGFNIDWLSLSIMAASLILHLRFKINPVILTLIAALVGYFYYLIIM